MAFCKNCGQQIPNGAQACVNCGTPVEQPMYQNPVQQPYQGSAQPPYQGSAQPPYQGQQSYQGQPMMDDDVKQNRSIAWLAYLGILLLIPLFVRKRSEFCKYHVKQGALIFCVSIVYFIITRIFLAVVGSIFPGHLYYYAYIPSPIYTVFNLIFTLGSIFLIVIEVIGIVYAATGKYKEVPVFGKIKILDPLMDSIYRSLNK